MVHAENGCETCLCSVLLCIRLKPRKQQLRHNILIDLLFKFWGTMILAEATTHIMWTALGSDQTYVLYMMHA